MDLHATLCRSTAAMPPACPTGAACTRRRSLAGLVGLLACAAAAQTPVCGASLSGATRIEGTRHSVAFAPQPAPWALGRHLAVELEVCPKPGSPAPTSVRVDARMPEHGHGMNYRPSIKPLGAGRWRAEGLLLHMAGRWEFSVELRQADGSAETLRHDLHLKP